MSSPLENVPLVGAMRRSVARRRNPDSRPPIDAAWARFAAELEPPYDVIDGLSAALDALALVVPAEAYFAYRATAVDGPLRLSVTHTAAGIPTVGPDYAGLVNGPPPRYAPLELPRMPANSCELVQRGTDTFLGVACGPNVALLAALPRDQALAGSAHEAARALAERLAPVLSVVTYRHAEESSVGPTGLTGHALDSGGGLYSQAQRAIELTCSLGAELVGATTGYLVTWPTHDPVAALRWHWQRGKAAGLASQLDPRGIRADHHAAGVAGWDAPNLPPVLLKQGIVRCVYVPVTVPPPASGALMYAAKEVREPSPRTALRSLARAVGTLLGNSQQVEHAAGQYVATLVELCDLLDACDPANVGHSRRVGEVAEAVAQELQLSPDQQETVRLAGRLHDLGMLDVSPGLVSHTGILEQHERMAIRAHANSGADFLLGLPPAVASTEVAAAIRYHHERWDGGGYPEGLPGTATPIEARVVACAECFIAHLSKRTYRSGRSLGRALAEMQKLAGSQLDPDTVTALVRHYARRGVHPEAPA